MHLVFADVVLAYRQLSLDPMETGTWFALTSKGLTTLTSASPLVFVGQQFTGKMSLAV